jgi:hypothetical protein
LSIPSNYLIAPNSHTFYFDSSKVGVSLAKNSTRDSIRLISGSGSVLATVKDSAGGGGLLDTTFLGITTNSLGTTHNFSKGIQIRNYTAATSGNQQISGQLTWTGQGYNSSSSVSQPVDVFADLFPLQNGGSPWGYLRFGFRTNGGTVTDNVLTIGATTTGTPGVGINATPQSTSGAALNVGGVIQTQGRITYTGTPSFDAFGNNFIDLTGSYLRLMSSVNSGYGTVTAKQMSIGKLTAPTPGAMLDVDNPGTAFLPPRGTQTQRDSINLQISSVTVTTAGTGYTSFPTVTITAGPTYGNNNATITGTISGGGLATATATLTGHFNNTPTLTLSGGGGSGGVLTPVMTQVLVAGMTYYCTNCTATDSSTGVLQVWNGSSWKNAW